MVKRYIRISTGQHKIIAMNKYNVIVVAYGYNQMATVAKRQNNSKRHINETCDRPPQQQQQRRQCNKRFDVRTAKCTSAYRLVRLTVTFAGKKKQRIYTFATMPQCIDVKLLD